MNDKFYGNFKLGILGGGQLGRMFIQETINFNIHVSVLDPDPEAPCNAIANEFICGELNDFETVYNFGKRVDLLTIEIEHVNVDALEKLEQEGIAIYPQPRVLRIIQDKGLQKNFFKQHHIPTPDYFLIDTKAEISKYSAHFPFMQKLRKGGYDGKGVTKLVSPVNLTNAFEAPSVLEKLVDFKKEISVIVARNASGEIKHFPVVELDFNAEANLVEFLFSPANVSELVAQQAYTIACTIAEKMAIVGLLAVELFVTKDDKVLVNEIAPRPHNSGHQTIEGNYTSQYEQHMRAILNLPLGATGIIIPSVMINLLGEKSFEGPVYFEGLESCMQQEGVYIHLYGKKMTRPFRKMGHVTVIDKDLNNARKKAIFVKENLKVKA